MLTQDQVEFYRENGYLVVEDAVDAEQLEALRRLTYDYIGRSREVTGNNDLYDLDEKVQKSGRAISAFDDIAPASPEGATAT